MNDFNSKSNITGINLQTTSYGNMKNFRTVLKRELIEFENKMREDDKQFDVYEWLGNLLEYNPSTIRKWLNQFDQTGTKIGLKDLQLICVYLNTIRPIEAFLYETTQIISSKQSKEIDERMIESIKDSGLKGSFLSGQACNEILKAFEDNELEPHEKEKVIAAVNDNINLWNELKNNIQKIEK